MAYWVLINFILNFFMQYIYHDVPLPPNFPSSSKLSYPLKFMFSLWKQKQIKWNQNKKRQIIPKTEIKNKTCIHTQKQNKTRSPFCSVLWRQLLNWVSSFQMTPVCDKFTELSSLLLFSKLFRNLTLFSKINFRNNFDSIKMQSLRFWLE